MIASDGYEYEDITQRLLGNPKVSHRNTYYRQYLRSFNQPYARAWAEGYDEAPEDWAVHRKLINADRSLAVYRANQRELGAAESAAAYGGLLDRAMYAALTRPS